MRALARRAVSVVAFAAGIISAAAAAPPPAEVFGQLPAISQVQLSPDGRHIALIRTVDGRLTPMVFETDKVRENRPVVLPTADWTADSFVWVNNARLIMVLRKTMKIAGDTEVRPWLRAVAVDVDGRNPVVLLGKERGFSNNLYAANIVSVDLEDGGHAYAALIVPYMSTLRSSLGYRTPEKVRYHLNLFQVDVNTGDAALIGSGEEGTTLWLMDGHGHIAARVDQDKQPLVEHVMVERDDNWAEIASFNAAGGHGADLLGLNIKGTALVRFDTGGPARTRGLEFLNLSDGKTGFAFHDPAYDVNVPLSEPWTGRIIGASTVDDQEHYHYFSPDLQAFQGTLEALFPGAAVLMASWDVAVQKIVAQVNGAVRPPAFYLVDRTTRKTDLLGETYPGLDEKQLGRITPYPYQARDGLRISAYLTLPPGKPAKNLPTVILPHGGPGERDWMQFGWLTQFLATRGYAVLQPNFRGSSGFGATFKEAGYGQWGLKMQDDITDATKKLIADGVADPRRICIVGASYGGYAAVAGAAFTPDLYACAASWAAITDTRRFLASRAQDYGRDSAAYSSWSAFIGEDDPMRMEATSPALNADGVKCPILLMHGTMDSVVRIDQGDAMNDALVRAGKAVQYVRFEGETHYMDKAETRIRVLKELERFLAANIGT